MRVSNAVPNLHSPVFYARFAVDVVACVIYSHSPEWLLDNSPKTRRGDILLLSRGEGGLLKLFRYLWNASVVHSLSMFV